MQPTDVLILMSCSATKRQTDKAIPAIELYDGPLWQTLRTHLGAIPTRNVCVLSGKYGFINALLTLIEPYEARLSQQAADRLIARGVGAYNERLGTGQLGHMPD